LVLCLLPLVACAPARDESIDARLASLERQVQEAEEVARRELKENVDIIFEEMVKDEASRAQREVRLDCTSTEFSWLEYRSLAFPIACKGAEPYLDGFKLNLNIGNLYSAEFSDLALELTWGATFLERIRSQGQEEPRSKIVRSSEVLHPGVWNSVEVVISPAERADPTNVRVRLEVERVRLRQP
jgi:hypothetical protein